MSFFVKILKGMLYVDGAISELLDRTQEDSSATEEDVKSILKKYSTKDCLASFSLLSKKMFNEKLNVIIDEKSSVVITQFALAYLSSMAVLSGGNDYKNKNLLNVEKSNPEGMCQIYNNCLPSVLNDKKELDIYGSAPFLIRMKDEQFSFQISMRDIFARAAVLFLKIPLTIQWEKMKTLDSIHLEKTGLKIKEFLLISFVLFELNGKIQTFTEEQLVNCKMQSLKRILTKEKIKKYLELLSRGYKDFRDGDERINRNIYSTNTKNRFNTLLLYPIVRLQTPTHTTSYIIPNNTAFMRRISEGLFWWFDTCLKSSDRMFFRDYFGRIFQEYVGRVLREIYGCSIIKPEFKYSLKKGKDFSDWWMIRNNKLYLFEVKARQVNLLNRRVSDVAKFKKEEILKIAETVEQLYKIVRSIRNGEVEASKIPRDIEVIPVAVFYDVPFVSESIYDQWLKDAVEKIEREKRLKGLSKLKVYFINVDKLEVYESVSDIVELEDIFEANERAGGSSNIISTMETFAKKASRELTSSDYLSKEYHKFFESMNI